MKDQIDKIFLHIVKIHDEILNITTKDREKIEFKSNPIEYKGDISTISSEKYTMTEALFKTHRIHYDLDENGHATTTLDPVRKYEIDFTDYQFIRTGSILDDQALLLDGRAYYSLCHYKFKTYYRSLISEHLYALEYIMKTLYQKTYDKFTDIAKEDVQDTFEIYPSMKTAFNILIENKIKNKEEQETKKAEINKFLEIFVDHYINIGNDRYDQSKISVLVLINNIKHVNFDFLQHDTMNNNLLRYNIVSLVRISISKLVEKYEEIYYLDN